MKNEYREIVDYLELGLKSYAKKSFEASSPEFIGGGEIDKYYFDHWNDDFRKARISNRTPLQIERDRILYSNGMRKLNEKNHVLYSGSQRVIRNYTTHTMRMAQVTRAICRGLGLNEDFAEGIALGAKVGSIPFVHVSKNSLSTWIEKKIHQIDKDNLDKSKNYDSQLTMFKKNMDIPNWLDQVKSEKVSEGIKKYFPWGAGNSKAHTYSSGKQGYWMLSTNPYMIEPMQNYYSPETMYGIWQHSLDENNTLEFHHDFEFKDGTIYELSSNNHDSLEATVVKYADDITWVIENLNDAHQVALMEDNENDIFKDLASEMKNDDSFPSNLMEAIRRENPGLFYTYFINDFVTFSNEEINNVLKNDENISRDFLIKEKVRIGLSPNALYALKKLKDYLLDSVFSTAKIENRNKMLRTITEATLEILWEDKRDNLIQLVNKMGKSRGWGRTKIERANNNIYSDEIHKIQTIVNVFSEMSDTEIFSFIGIESF